MITILHSEYHYTQLLLLQVLDDFCNKAKRLERDEVSLLPGGSHPARAQPVAWMALVLLPRPPGQIRKVDPPEGSVIQTIRVTKIQPRAL